MRELSREAVDETRIETLTMMHMAAAAEVCKPVAEPLRIAGNVVPSGCCAVTKWIDSVALFVLDFLDTLTTVKRQS
jgi:hypothetical protein